MKIYEEVQVTTSRLVKRRCDLCGVESKYCDWTARAYDIAETEIKVSIKQKEGENYPEGGWGTEYDIDLCPRCFKERLIPWLRSEGADIKEKEWDC